jgi:hypothetical protein
MKPWFSHKNCRRSSYASRNLISKTGMASWDNSRQNEARIFEIRQKLSEREQKTALSLYFRADFNNSPTILTRIFSRFRIYIQNLNPTSTVRLASFLKYITKNWLLFNQFSSDFNDSHANLTSIVSQIHSCFRNKNRTRVARMATILVYVIEF